MNWLDAAGNFGSLATAMANTVGAPEWLSNTAATLNDFFSSNSILGTALTWTADWFGDYAQQLLYLDSIVTTHDPVEEILSAPDIQRYSAEILDLMRKLNLQGYTDATMVKIACDKFLEDGAIVDSSKLHYDERKTENGGNSLRKRFFNINNQINAYHDLLAGLKGEVRVNLNEKIPIIDFYKDSFSMQHKYLPNTSHTEIAEIESNVDLGDLYNETTKVHHDASINLSLKAGSPFEELFFHPDYLTLQVDSTGAEGAPFLAGKFGSEPLRDNNDKISGWTLVDKVEDAAAENASLIISPGTYFNPVFLDNSGYYIERPLESSTPAYSTTGLATEYLDQVLPYITAFKTTHENASWATEDPSGVSDVSYHLEPGAHRLATLGDLSTSLASWDSHYSGAIFTISTDIAEDTVAYREALSSYRNNAESEDDRNMRARANTAHFRAQNLPFAQGALNHHCRAIVARTGTSEYKVMSITALSPFDILKEKYDASGVDVIGKADSQYSFLYSATEFQGVNGIVKFFRSLYSILFKSSWNRRGRRRRGWSLDRFPWKGELRAADPTLYLIRTTAIPSLSVDESLFFYQGRGRSAKVIGFKVTEIVQYLFPADMANVRVKYSTNVITPDENTQYFPATPCYRYKLEPLELTTADGGFSFDPFCYPRDHFMIETDGSFSMRYSGVRDLRYAYYKRKLPVESGGAYNYTVSPNSSVSTSALSKVLGTNTIATFLKNKLLPLPLVQVSYSDDTPVFTLEDAIPLFKTLLKHAPAMSKLPIAGAEVFKSAYVGQLKKYSAALEALKVQSSFTLDMVAELDALFGNTASPPWIETTPGEPFYIADDLFAQMSEYIIQQLEGTYSGGNSLKRVRDEEIIGSKDGLYYRRYQILNQRMNKINGPLYQAGCLQKSSKILDQNVESIYDKLEILKYDLDVIPLYDSQKLVFINNKFIDQAKYDLVRQNIGDKCLLTCGSCVVKLNCPFYNEQEVILELLDAEKTFSVYIKDNQLDLISSMTLNGKNITSRIRERHRAFAEIERDEDIRLIDDVVDEIVAIQPKFRNKDGELYDNLGWLTKARYGSLKITNADGMEGNSYLYDAMFFADTESDFSYSAGEKFTVTTDAGEYKVKMIAANAITTFSNNDQIFLVSDDGYDPIYLGLYKNLHFDIRNPQESQHYAEASVNMLDLESQDQAWQKSYTVKGETHIGRLRTNSKSELIGDGSYTKESILAGKPNIRKYTDFLREVRIPIANIQWTLSGKNNEILNVKQTLSKFVTNVRLVNVQG